MYTFLLSKIEVGSHYYINISDNLHFHGETVIVTSLVVLLGGSLASGGSMAINMWYERDIDPFMKRTAKRPIHAGFISPTHALLFGICMCLIGITTVTFYTTTEAGIITAFSAFFSMVQGALPKLGCFR